MRKELFLEFIILGFIGVILQFIMYTIITKKLLSPNDKGFYQMIIGQFFIFGIAHIIFEILDINKWWCKNTYSL